MVERLPGDLPRIAFVYGDAALALHVREAMTGRAELAYSAAVGDFDADRLVDAGVVAALVNIDDRDWLNDIEASLERVGVPVVFNDPDISRQLEGWDRARWLRHLTAKLRGSADVDPPRPGLSPVAAGEWIEAFDGAPGRGLTVMTDDDESANAEPVGAAPSNGVMLDAVTDSEPVSEVLEYATPMSTATVTSPAEPAGSRLDDALSQADPGAQAFLNPDSETELGMSHMQSPETITATPMTPEPMYAIEAVEPTTADAVVDADDVPQGSLPDEGQAEADATTEPSSADAGEPGPDARRSFVAEVHGAVPVERPGLSLEPLEPGQGPARDVAREIRGVILRVTGGRVLVPSTTMAEIITFARPESLPGTPPWLPGRVAWQGWRVPVVAFSALAGIADGEVPEQARVVILKALSGQPGLPYFGMLSQGFPRLALISEDALEADEEAGPLPLGVREQVRLRDEPAWIPDLPAVEAAIVEALKAAA